MVSRKDNSMENNIIEIPTILRYEVLLGDVVQDSGGTITVDIESVKFNQDLEYPIVIKVHLRADKYLIQLPTYGDSEARVTCNISATLCLPCVAHYESYLLGHRKYELKEVSCPPVLGLSDYEQLILHEIQQKTNNQFFNQILFTLKPLPQN